MTAPCSKPLLSQTWSIPPQHFYRQVLNYCSPRNRVSKVSGADARQTLMMKCRVKPTLDIQGAMFYKSKRQTDVLSGLDQANGPAQHVVRCVDVANRGADVAVSHGAHQHPNAHTSGGQSCGKTAAATVATGAVNARAAVQAVKVLGQRVGSKSSTRFFLRGKERPIPVSALDRAHIGLQLLVQLGADENDAWVAALGLICV